MQTKQKANLIITNAREVDFEEIQKIYSHYVETATISLEEISPNVDEMISRWRGSVDKSLPYLVAKVDGVVAGYAYAFPYRSRTAYRFTVEESVYVSKNYHGLGIGKKLLCELISQCKNKGYHQMLAVIAGTDNEASIKFHQNLGFKKSGVLEKFGFKFNKWIDTVLMQREL